jgi:PAS domain S-box-containing protein
VAPIRILLLEDSAPDAELVAARLAEAGLDLAMDRVETREAFVAALGATSYDLILAEPALPAFDGRSALEVARQMRPQVPFLFVSGGQCEEEAIVSPEGGATDYVPKHRIDRLAPAVARALAESRERADRRRAEEALRRSEEHRRLILESVKDYAIFTLDVRGRVSSWNPGAERVLGYAEDEIVGRPCAAIFTPEDVARGEPDAEIARAATEGRSEDERWHVRKDGTRFWAGGVVRPLLDEGGALRGFVKVMHDMTERKRAEEALREADRRKDDFLAMLAHELRNPLSAINNAIQLARRSVKVEHQEWAKDVIGQQVKHLARLIDDLLDVSRITRGKIQLRVEPHDAAAIVRGAVESVRPAFEARRHRLSVSVAAGPLPVEADATRMEQVFVNLLSNAAKYTEEGGRVAIDARREGPEVVVRVRDDGIGIEPEMLARIFEPFVQAEQAIDRSQGGLGVGLTLARRLVEMHGGTLAASSAGRGLGSEFTVRLPLSGAAAATPDAGDPRAGAADPQGPRVLIVDDNVESAECLATLLNMVGYDAQTAFDGRSALEAAMIDRPEIVLLDIGLPGMDGYELAATLRRDRRLEDALLIAITGYGQDEDRRRSAEAGFNHHLVKPVDVDALLELLARPEPSSRARPGAP